MSEKTMTSQPAKDGRLIAVDISKEADLYWGTVELTSMEDHANSTFLRTGEKKWLILVDKLRRIRGQLMRKLERKMPDTEFHCFAKHSFSAVKRMQEVGIKEYSLGNKKEAHFFYDKAREIFMIFWSLNKGDDETLLKVCQKRVGNPCKKNNDKNKH